MRLLHGDPQAKYLGQPLFNEHSRLPGPLWTAFCAAGLKLFGTIRGVGVLMLLTDTAAILVTYLFTSLALGARAAPWAALLHATSPLAVQYATIVFNPSVLAILGGLFFLALWFVTQKDRSPAIFWVSVLPLVTLQFNFFGVVMAPTAIALIWLSGKRTNRLWLTAGLLVGVACFVPYLVGEIANHWQNTGRMLEGRPGHFSANAFIAPLAFLYNYWSPPWAYTGEEYDTICRWCFGGPTGALFASIISVIAIVAIVWGVALVVHREIKKPLPSLRESFKRCPGLMFVVIALLFPLSISLLLGQIFHPRYALMLLVPLFGLCGAGLAAATAFPSGGVIVRSLVALMVAIHVWFIFQVNRAQNEVIETTGRFIPTFRHLENVYQTLQSHAGAGRMVRVNDAEFTRRLSPQEAKLLSGAELIRRYIDVRCVENGETDKTHAVPYILRRAHEVAAGRDDVVYLKNGIAIVRGGDGN